MMGLEQTVKRITASQVLQAWWAASSIGGEEAQAAGAVGAGVAWHMGQLSSSQFHCVTHLPAAPHVPDHSLCNAGWLHPQCTSAPLPPSPPLPWAFLKSPLQTPTRTRAHHSIPCRTPLASGVAYTLSTNFTPLSYHCMPGHEWSWACAMTRGEKKKASNRWFSCVKNK
jgi:hypothetical protein